MEYFKALNDNEMEAVIGGASGIFKNTTNWRGAHWQPSQYAMGTTFFAYGYRWYRIKYGDTLEDIAKTFGTTTQMLCISNPATFADTKNACPGDAIILSR